MNGQNFTTVEAIINGLDFNTWLNDPAEMFPASRKLWGICRNCSVTEIQSFIKQTLRRWENHPGKYYIDLSFESVLDQLMDRRRPQQYRRSVILGFVNFWVKYTDNIMIKCNQGGEVLTNIERYTPEILDRVLVTVIEKYDPKTIEDLWIFSNYKTISYHEYTKELLTKQLTDIKVKCFNKINKNILQETTLSEALPARNNNKIKTLEQVQNFVNKYNNLKSIGTRKQAIKFFQDLTDATIALNALQKQIEQTRKAA